MITDATLLRINEGVALHHHAGRPAEARDLLTRIWTEIGEEKADPLHVSVLAHAMADVQDDPQQELLWDERALAAVNHLTDDRLAEAGVPMTVTALRPSLHINLADCHRKLGDPDEAHRHLDQARAHLDALPDDDYGRLIRDGFDRMTQLLTAQPGEVRPATRHRAGDRRGTDRRDPSATP